MDYTKILEWCMKTSNIDPNINIKISEQDKTHPYELVKSCTLHKSNPGERTGINKGQVVGGRVRPRRGRMVGERGVRRRRGRL